jgi:hypothetical protein
VWAIAAVLTSPVASAVAWHAAAGTGLSTTSLRIGPSLLAAIPWPAGDPAPAMACLAEGDIEGCGRAICDAYGVSAEQAERLVAWWSALLPARA